MQTSKFPDLEREALAGTRDALHAYAGILGACLKAHRKKRKHWWHASLRPSLFGLSTGVVHADVNFELELDLYHSLLHVRTSTGLSMTEVLAGQSQAELASVIVEALDTADLDVRLTEQRFESETRVGAYDSGQARRVHQALAAVAGTLREFRAGIREETSPIQLWPHHFDLSMIWLPGQKVPGKDPADEEQADKQMNFGFVFGDAEFVEPYFYVTAYPLPDALPDLELPDPAHWHSEGFSGAVMTYRELCAQPDPGACLLDFWSAMLASGRSHLAIDD